ncbi:MAG: DUF6174 domain-containing protein [Pirellulales bacterium]
MRTTAGPGARLSRIALAAALLVGLVLAAMVTIRSLAPERLPAMTPETLSAAEKLWAENGPASYDLDLVIEGAQPGPVHVEVRDGVTVAMQRDGRTPTQRRVWDVWSVPGMFDTLEIELQNAQDPQHEMDLAADARVQVRAAFDPKFGYPARFHRIVFGGGPEVYWRVTYFQPK